MGIPNKYHDYCVEFLKEKTVRSLNLAAARACPSSCTDTETMVDIHKYPMSASEMVKPESCTASSVQETEISDTIK